MKAKAYAKINLTLDVLSKREDGYHLIDSVMQTISLCDDISVKKSPNISVSCNIADLCGEDNIVFKAAKEFFAFSDINGGAEIFIKKRIPVSSGLGGGSSDAAEVIKCLNLLYKTNFDYDALNQIALKVGADVPYFLVGKTARVRGIGEKVERITRLSHCGVLLIKNGDKESTALMYKKIDECKDNTSLTENFIEELESGKFEFNNIGNAFLSVFRDLRVENSLKSLFPVCFSLSGSGPTYFAVFESERKAKSAAKILKKKGFYPIVASFV